MAAKNHNNRDFGAAVRRELEKHNVPALPIKQIVLIVAKRHKFKKYLKHFGNKKINLLCDCIERIIKGEKISLISPSYLKTVQIAGPMPIIQQETIRDIMFTIGIKGETAICSAIIADGINKYYQNENRR